MVRRKEPQQPFEESTGERQERRMEIVVNERIKARLKQLQRKTGTSMSEISRQGIVHHIFVETPLLPHEEAELEQIIAEETAEREERARKRQQKQK